MPDPRHRPLPQSRALLLAVVALTSGIAASAGAQAGRTVHDGVYTEAQAARGAMVYGKECAFCHGDDLLGGGFAAPLVGEPFETRWKSESAGDLFIIVKATMPADGPSRLSDQQYADVLAYLLQMNKWPAGKAELGTAVAELKTIKFRR